MPTKPLSKLQSLVGESRTTADDFTIEAGKVEEFARAITDTRPLHQSKEAARAEGYDATPAPLTYATVSSFPRYRPEGVGAGLGFDLGFERGKHVHGEQAYTFERPVYVGDVLSAETTLVDVSQKEGGAGGTMTFATYETEFTDAEDHLVLTAERTRIELGQPPGEG